MGGRNVTIHIAAQSRPQLRKRWGHDGAAAILNNAASCRDLRRHPRPGRPAGLLHAGGGTRRADPHPRSHRQGRSRRPTQRVPVLTPAQIAQLRAGRVLVIRRGMPPVIGKVTMAWQRRDVRAVKRAERRAKRAEKRAVVWERRRQTWQRYWGELKDAARRDRRGDRPGRPGLAGAASTMRAAASGPGNWKPNAPATNASTPNRPGRTSTSSPTRTSPASQVTAMSSRLRSLIHPVRVARAFATALAERADADARRRRPHRRGPAERGTPLSRPPPRPARRAPRRAGPAAPANRMPGRRTEHGGPNASGGAGAVPAPTVPHQGRSGFASASHATACGGP